ncbi:hypothetical protein [Paenisporosarcina sp. TG-14]|uniref:hypothetical protein n=1 Tax=Paenisporosarcina sp. TG-14 TaxID=1231057 RepID=UPI0002E262B5|nr:hypothetical protein [Paenisporosarcina sp. TG-14]
MKPLIFSKKNTEHIFRELNVLERKQKVNQRLEEIANTLRKEGIKAGVIYRV